MFVWMDHDSFTVRPRGCDVTVPIVLWKPPVKSEEECWRDAADDQYPEPGCPCVSTGT